MIGALQKISSDSIIESIDKGTVAAMCIASPFAKTGGIGSWFKNLFSTHPSIEDRIATIRTY
jgi:Zn-dependent protease with chaperone function